MKFVNLVIRIFDKKKQFFGNINLILGGGMYGEIDGAERRWRFP
jgi:hypothetical protein